MNKDLEFQTIEINEYVQFAENIVFNKKRKNKFIASPILIEVITEKSKLLCFTQSGSFFSMLINELNDESNVKELLHINRQDKVINIICIENGSSHYQNLDLIFVTRNGIVKRSKLDLYLNNSLVVKSAIKLKKNDLLVDVKLSRHPNDRILICSKSNRLMRFDVSRVKASLINTIGIKGINLEDENDYVVGMSIEEGAEEYLLTITNTGNTRKSEINDYRITYPGGKGVKNGDDKYNIGVTLTIDLAQNKNVFLASTNLNNDIAFRANDLIKKGRVDKGRNIAKLSKGEKIVNVVRLPHQKKLGISVINFIYGEKYDGGFKDDKRHGSGCLVFTNGNKYIGGFKDDKFEGNGTLTFSNGDKYVGGFKKGKYDGIGVLTFLNGDKYIGDFKDGKYNGSGTFISSKGFKYIGEYEDGKFNGSGVLTSSDGENYKGDFKNNKYDGFGTLNYKNGDKYIGDFKDGIKSGFGTLILLNGEQKIGRFEDDVFEIAKKTSSNNQVNFNRKLFQSVNKKHYLFFDTETTGLPKNYNAPATDFNNWPRLVQLAYLLFDDDGNKVSSNNFIIKPEGFTIPISASNLHGITTERALREGESIINVLKDFILQVSKADYLVAHNMEFDEKIIGSELLRNGFKDFTKDKNKICTKLKSTKFCAIKSIYGYKWPSLSELHIKLFGVDFEDSHDAMADVSATAKCFWELRSIGEI